MSLQHFIKPVTDVNFPDPSIIAANEQTLTCALGIAFDYYEPDQDIWDALVSSADTYQQFLWSLAREGLLPIACGSPNMPVFSPAQPTDAQLKGISPRIRALVSGYMVPPRAFYCFTRGELWWNGPKSFLVDNHLTRMLMVMYEKAHKGDLELQDYLSPRAKKAVSGPKAPNSMYNDWLAECALIGERIEDLRLEYEARATAAETARLAYKGLKKPTWEEYKKAHTT
jgi:hypothetical protein